MFVLLTIICKKVQIYNNLPCLSSICKKSFKPVFIWSPTLIIFVCHVLMFVPCWKQSAARGACEGRVTRREILGDCTFPQLDFCSFARLATSAFFAQTISTAVPTVSSNKVEKRDERWDFKAFSHHSSWVQHHCQQFWLPHVQPGSRTQVKEKEESIAHFGPFAAESVQKVFNQKNSRYVVSELDRRDILEDVSIQYKS